MSEKKYMAFRILCILINLKKIHHNIVNAVILFSSSKLDYLKFTNVRFTAVTNTIRLQSIQERYGS